ncbi:Cyclic di-GMP phosphodiesterase YfgF [Serratia fonticola]|uniref:Cyclic di-GMP phosphodiesterase YfgF n=1 Tax=Serratia fonticola TaxID=47917 RepID=A0A4U9UTU5_SERFO|nr:Cyclic di-GMP phosphodiesterase YfgF [Serratia fonticola]
MYLVYLPLVVCFSLLMVYDWRAMPGIALAILIRYSNRTGSEVDVIMTLLYVGCLSICWWGYRCQSQRHWCVGLTELKLGKHRLIWLVLMPPVLFIFGLQLVIGLDLLPDELGMLSGSGNHLHALINFQAILIGCLSSMQLFYFALRIIKNPKFARVLWGRISREMAPSVKKSELQLWVGGAGCLGGGACLPLGRYQRDAGARLQPDAVIAGDVGIAPCALVICSTVLFGQQPFWCCSLTIRVMCNGTACCIT